MCLALPGIVDSTDGLFAHVRIGRVFRKVVNSVDARQGETVLIQQGAIVDRIDHSEAQAMVSALAKTRRKKKPEN